LFTNVGPATDLQYPTSATSAIPTRFTGLVYVYRTTGERERRRPEIGEILPRNVTRHRNDPIRSRFASSVRTRSSTHRKNVQVFRRVTDKNAIRRHGEIRFRPRVPFANTRRLRCTRPNAAARFVYFAERSDENVRCASSIGRRRKTSYDLARGTH